MKKATIQSGIIALLFILTSCGCDFCTYYEEPEWGTLEINVTLNAENPGVPVVLYRGKKVEQGTAIWKGRMNGQYWDTMVQTGYYYSAKATYKHDGGTVVAIDHAEVTTKKRSACEDTTCYKIKEGTIDLELNQP